MSNVKKPPINLDDVGDSEDSMPAGGQPIPPQFQGIPPGMPPGYPPPQFPGNPYMGGAPPGYPPQFQAPPMYNPGYYQPQPTQTQRSSPGRLSYAGDSKSKNGGSSGGSMNLPTALLGAILGIVGSLMAIVQLAPWTSVAETAKKEVTAQIQAANIPQLQTQVTNLVNSQGLYAKLTDVDTKIAAAPAANSYTKTETYTQAQVNQLLTDLKADQSWIKVNTGTTSTNSTNNGTTTPVPTGTVSYVIQNPQQFYQLIAGTPYNFSFRIVNNKSEARYVRPTFTFSPYNNTIAPLGTVITPATPAIISNTLGQPSIAFTTTPIADASGVRQVIMMSTSGGVMSGQYLVPAGGGMDIVLQVSSNNTVLWTVSFSGSDVSSITGY